MRRNPQISGTTHNIFGIQTGVAIGIFVREKAKLGQCEIHYAAREDAELAKDKLAFLQEATITSINFDSITPDKRNQWLNQSSSNFNTLIPIIREKLSNRDVSQNAQTLFGLYSTGITSHRDDWVHDFDSALLGTKVRAFINSYEESRAKFGGTNFLDSMLGTNIKWSSDLVRQLRSDRPNTFERDNIISTIYRPFVAKYLYFHNNLNWSLYQMPRIFPGGKPGKNKIICFSGVSSSKPFQILASDRVIGLDTLEKTQCLPLYSYNDNGEQVSNITAWGIRQFNDHYRKEWGNAFKTLAGPEGITAEDIFGYTYAILHDPSYRADYRLDLLRDFPRLPFYPEFNLWKQMGQELLDLHIGFEEAERYPLERVDLEGDPRRIILRADKEKATIVLDDKTTLRGVPPEAWEYQLGNRSALEWILDQYKEKKPKDPTIAERFNTYRFADYKEQVIDLLQRVCTVSVKTMEVVSRMTERNIQYQTTTSDS